MGTAWEFTTDTRSDALCQDIAGEMARLFGVTAEEAIGRINWAWRGLEIVGDDLVYHELPEHWANQIYWTDESFWWVAGEARERLALGPPVPRPYPPSQSQAV